MYANKIIWNGTEHQLTKTWLFRTRTATTSESCVAANTCRMESTAINNTSATYARLLFLSALNQYKLFAPTLYSSMQARVYQDFQCPCPTNLIQIYVRRARIVSPPHTGVWGREHRQVSSSSCENLVPKRFALQVQRPMPCMKCLEEPLSHNILKRGCS